MIWFLIIIINIIIINIIINSDTSWVSSFLTFTIMNNMVSLIVLITDFKQTITRNYIEKEDTDVWISWAEG